MENRLRKLMNEEDRLMKQTDLALANQDFADRVSGRRMDDFNYHTNWLNDRENKRLAALALNTHRREENKSNIGNAKHRVLSQNVFSRKTAGSNTNSNVMFGALQLETAKALDFSHITVASTQSIGGAIGSSIAPAKVLVGTTIV